MDIDKIIDEERLILRMARGTIESIPVELELRKDGSNYCLNFRRTDSKYGYDCQFYDTLFFADRGFSKLEKKYGLKECSKNSLETNQPLKH